MSRVVTVSVMSGLGNRMRVYCGGLSIARELDVPFRYHWPTGRKFAPTLADLWHPQGRAVGRLGDAVARLRGPSFDEKLDGFDPRGDSPIYIKTKHALNLPGGYASWGASLRSLVPVSAVERRVREVWEHELAGEPYVGVMVRAHRMAHDKTKAVSTPHTYFERIAQIRDWWPDVRLFVSSDAVEASDEIEQRFGGTVVVRDKGEYNSIAGVQSAVVDLYLLASSTAIVGPYWSSFTPMAAHLGGGLSLEDAKTPESQRFAATDRRSVVDDPLRPWERRSEVPKLA